LKGRGFVSIGAQEVIVSHFVVQFTVTILSVSRPMSTKFGTRVLHAIVLSGRDFH